MAVINFEIPEKLSFLSEPHRIKCLWGGRGSSKSWSIARVLLIKALEKKTRILCAREVQRSLRESSHRLISDQIEMLSLGKYFEITREEIRCKRNGSQFLFAGLATSTVDSIKSYANVDICWVEEGQVVSERSWEILTPTIRSENSEIWISMNPELDKDPTYIRYIKLAHTLPDCVSVKINYDENPYFPEVLRQEMEYMKKTDYDAYCNIWLGECKKHSDAIVFKGKYSSDTFIPRLDIWDGPYYGVDWGFAADPTVITKSWISDDNKLYIEHEAWELHTEIPMLASLFDSIESGAARKYVIRADNNNPILISHLKREGYTKIIAGKKWSGNVEDGIHYMKSFNEIIIHPRCVRTLEEFGLFSYKKDRLSGDILPLFIGKWDHCISSLRYALEPMILGHTKKIIEKEKANDKHNEEILHGFLSNDNWMT